MWMDHVTLAVHRLDALDGGLTELGLRPAPAPAWFPGSARAVVPLARGFLELVTVLDARAVRRYTLGQSLLRFLRGGEGIFRVVVGVPDLEQFVRLRRALGVRCWPPIDEQLTGLTPEPLAVRMTQIDAALPWIMAYQGSVPPAREGRAQFLSLEISSSDPAVTARHYQMALGCPINDPPPGGTPVMSLDQGALQFQRGEEGGWTRVVLGGAAPGVVAVRGGRLSARLVAP